MDLERREELSQTGGMFSYSFYFECYEVSTTTFGGAPTLLSTLYFCCKFEYSLLWRLLSLTHWCWSLEAEGGDSLDADLAVEALEGGVHGGGGEAVAQGAPVHTAYTGQVISLVGIHTSSQGCAQIMT